MNKNYNFQANWVSYKHMEIWIEYLEITFPILNFIPILILFGYFPRLVTEFCDPKKVETKF